MPTFRSMLFVSATILLLATSPLSAADRPNPAPAAPMPAAQEGYGKLPPPSVYAYPGKACPAGSEKYKGPEQAEVISSGAIYCKFARNIYTFEKTQYTKCPAGLWAYKDAKSKPDDDVIWCSKNQPADQAVGMPDVIPTAKPK